MDLDNSKLWHDILGKHLSDVTSRKLDLNSRHLYRYDPLKIKRSLTADFCCKDCGRKWNSRTVEVHFLYKLDYHRKHGEIEIKELGRQGCQTCNIPGQEVKFNAPKIDYDSAVGAVEKIKQKILEKFYGEQTPETTGTRHDFKERKKPHDMDNCEACLNGFCMANEERREMGEMVRYTNHMEKPPERIFTAPAAYGPKIAQWKIKLNGTELNMIENAEEDKIAENGEVLSSDCYPLVPASAGPSSVPAGNTQRSSLGFQTEGNSDQSIYSDHVSPRCSRSQVTPITKVSSMPWPSRLVPSGPPLLQDVPGQKSLGLPQKRSETLDWPETIGETTTTSPIRSYPPELVVKLRNLQTSVITIKDEMRQYGDENQSQWSAITDQINEILHPIEELVEKNSALDLLTTRRPFENVALNGFNNEAFQSVSFKRKASNNNFENDSSQRPTKMNKMSEARDSETFMVNPDGFVEVYTDGVCQDNGKDFARAGVGVWWGDNHKLNVSRPAKGSKHTNNVAAIQAANVAIEMAVDNDIEKLLVNTDSQFLINSATEWMSNWKKNGWRTKSRQPVKNREDLEDLDKALNCGSIQVKWNYVKGHGGQEGNKEAEKLAMKGAYK